MAKRYEVESELNPRYTETNATEDYYGVYHVVEYDGETRVRVVKTYSQYTNSRSDAYNHAAALNNDLRSKETWVGFKFTRRHITWEIVERRGQGAFESWVARSEVGTYDFFSPFELDEIKTRAEIEREIKEMEEAKEHYRRDQHPGKKWD